MREDGDMRIGITARGSTPDEVVQHAREAERDGFSSIWYSHLLMGDPLAVMVLAGRATSSIELGTAVLQTYPCHPLLQANRTSAAATAMGRPGLTVGLGPSHRHIVEDVYGFAYDHPGRSTEEYLRIYTGLMRGEDVEYVGEDWSVHSARRMVAPSCAVPVLLAALSPRLLRVAGQYADGTIMWMAPPTAIESHVAPTIQKAAAAAGRSAPRIVAGLPVAVHSDVNEARDAAARSAVLYDQVPNYRRIMELGHVSGAAEASIVGDATSVRSQLQSILDAGATEIWAGIFPVGEDQGGSIRRTYEALAEMI
jgi:F420-dependent oxidoreductase-like protein